MTVTPTDQTQTPMDCPYTIRQLHKATHSSTYLIREHDTFGEYPNIFVKVYYHPPPQHNKPTVLILSDSGTGYESTTRRSNSRVEVELEPNPEKGDDRSTSQSPTKWNIATFLETTLNASHAAPYIVLTTHCHYDHICGIQHLLDAKVDVTVLSSSHDKAYLSPWENLQRHSLCDSLGLKAPRYDIQWIDDGEKIRYGSDGDGGRKESSIVVFHTPGHTTDSISWYDRETRVVSVGDMFYERESDETRSGSNGQWKREPPAPVIFERRSDINDWSASMHRLLDLVRLENGRLAVEKTGRSGDASARRYRQDGRGEGFEYIETAIEVDEWELVTASSTPSRVVLCAAHVTVAVDAESALLDMISFMLRIQLDQVPRIKVVDLEDGDDIWLWDDCLSSYRGSSRRPLARCNYSVRAPWSIIHPTPRKVSVQQFKASHDAMFGIGL